MKAQLDQLKNGNKFPAESYMISSWWIPITPVNICARCGYIFTKQMATRFTLLIMDNRTLTKLLRDTAIVTPSSDQYVKVWVSKQPMSFIIIGTRRIMTPPKYMISRA